MRADLLPPRKRIRGSVTAFDYDDCIERSYEAFTKPDIDFDVQLDIDTDVAATEIVVALEVGIGIIAYVGVEVGIRMRGRTGSKRMSSLDIEVETRLLDRIRISKRDNMRLHGMLCVERDRIDSLRRHMSYTQEELRKIRMSLFYDRAYFRRLETFAMRSLGYRLKACAIMTYVSIGSVVASSSIVSNPYCLLGKSM
nr:hypothetical protein [Tanacetum cinerariifolium]